MRLRVSLSILAIAAALSCAPPPAATSSGGARRDPNVISLAEIQQSHEDNAYDVVSKLRPSFLHNRGKSTIQTEAPQFPAVFLDNQYFGELESLRNIVATQIQEIRLYGPTEVSTRFGMQYGAGVIVVKTR